MLHEDLHRKLVTMFDSLTREDIDSRNSSNREGNIWYDIAKYFNDHSLMPQSFVFIDLHPMFHHAMDLSLSAYANELTANTVRMIIKHLWAGFKKAVINRHTSRNGKENLAKDGENLLLCFTRMEYDRELTPNPNGDQITICYIDDDCQNFCNLMQKPFSAHDHRSPITITVNAPIFPIHIKLLGGGWGHQIAGGRW
jgi:hypothetical protein